MKNLPKPKFHTTIDIVCDFYEIEPHLLFERTRAQPIAQARQIVMFIMYELGGMRRAELAVRFDRDWSAVQQSIQKMSRELNLNSHLRRDIIKLAEKATLAALKENKEPV